MLKTPNNPIKLTLTWESITNNQKSKFGDNEADYEPPFVFAQEPCVGGEVATHLLISSYRDSLGD